MMASELTVQRQLTFYQMSDLIFHLTPSGYRYRKVVNYIHQITEEVIQKRRLSLLKEEEQQRLKENKKLDLLDVLLTAKVQMHRNQHFVLTITYSVHIPDYLCVYTYINANVG